LLVGIIAQLPELEEVLNQGFGQQPSAEIYASQPALGVILGARVLVSDLLTRCLTVADLAS
jgi:hypothetical protein